MKAFPQLDTETYDQFRDKGMDLRDYFAAKAMLAIGRRYYAHEILENEYTKDLYKAAYAMADAMMEARGK